MCIRLVLISDFGSRWRLGLLLREFDVDGSGDPNAEGWRSLYTHRRQHKLLVTTPVKTFCG